MSAVDKKISDILAKYDEPFAGAIWRVQGQPVIYHKVVERIAAKAGVSFDMPVIARATDEEAVLIVSGRLGERLEWSVGEAKIGANYRVSGKQAAYLWSMAEKRGKDRVVLKLIELHGLVYSEEESDEFKNSAPAQPARAEQAGGELSPPASPSADAHKTPRFIADALLSSVRLAKTVGELTAWASNNAGTIEELPEDLKDDVRQAYAALLHDLKRKAA